MTDRSVDVAIVGGGLAGAVLGAVLHARGIDCLVCDPEQDRAADFRAEKISPTQARTFERLGLGNVLARCTTPAGTLAVARRGRVVEQRRSGEYGVAYGDLVAAIRQMLPAERRMRTTIVSAEAGRDAQRLTGDDGCAIEARLLVLATGLGQRLLALLGIERIMLSPNHCLAIGFDVVQLSPAAIPHMTVHGRPPADGIAYLSFFPIGGRVRANLFVYRAPDDPAVKALRRDPLATLTTLLPNLATLLPPFAVDGPVVVRPVDLYGARGVERDGCVLIGDAFATACPAGGGGVDKVLADVETLAALVPDWLSTPGMARGKIDAFYRHPTKRSADRRAARAARFARAITLEPGLGWTLQRAGRFAAQRLRAWARGAFASP